MRGPPLRHAFKRADARPRRLLRPSESRPTPEWHPSRWQPLTEPFNRTSPNPNPDPGPDPNPFPIPSPKSNPPDPNPPNSNPPPLTLLTLTLLTLTTLTLTTLTVTTLTLTTLTLTTLTLSPPLRLAPCPSGGSNRPRTRLPTSCQVHRRPRPHPRPRRPRATTLWSMSEGAITSHPIRMAVRRPRGPVGPKEGRGDRSPPCGSKVHYLPPLPRATWTRWCQALLFSKVKYYYSIY